MVRLPAHGMTGAIVGHRVATGTVVAAHPRCTETELTPTAVTNHQIKNAVYAGTTTVSYVSMEKIVVLIQNRLWILFPRCSMQIQPWRRRCRSKSIFSSHERRNAFPAHVPQWRLWSCCRLRPTRSQNGHASHGQQPSTSPARPSSSPRATGRWQPRRTPCQRNRRTPSHPRSHTERTAKRAARV
jgi:hypothetical protein